MTLAVKLSLRRLRLHRVAEFGETIRQPQRCGASVGRSHQRHLGLVDRREAFLRGQDAMVGLDRYLRQDAQAETGADRSLNPGKARTGIGLCQVRPALRWRGWRRRDTGSRRENRSAESMAHDRSTGCALLVTQCTRSGHTAMAPFSPAGALEQREVEVAALQIAPQVDALVGADVEPQARPRAGETRQQFGQAIGGKILRNAEPHRAFVARPRQHVARFLGQRQHAPRVGQQPNAAAVGTTVLPTVEQRPADIVLQPLDLLADGRLRLVDPFAGAGKTAGIHDGDKAAQQVEMNMAHTIHISTENQSII